MVDSSIRYHIALDADGGWMQQLWLQQVMLNSPSCTIRSIKSVRLLRVGPQGHIKDIDTPRSTSLRPAWPATARSRDNEAAKVKFKPKVKRMSKCDNPELQ